MRKWIFYIVALVCLAQPLYAQEDRHFRLPAEASPDDYLPNKVIIKLSETAEFGGEYFSPSSQLQSTARQRLKARNIQSMNQQLDRVSGGRMRPSQYLRNMYEITLEPGADIQDEINKLLQFGNVLYAEPVYTEQLFFTPNDPDANPGSGSQGYLQVINAYNAWDVEQGDPSVTVAVIDTGGDIDHPDMTGNLILNTADPVNGIDDDGDGVVDNFNGYDFADEDHDPSADQSGHGVLVGGLSSAATNNGTGMAGVGFNSGYVPYKIFQTSTGLSTNSYAAVLFAAQHHDVLNLSWGNVFYSQANQDIINAAVLEYDAVIVAAAGNTPIEIEFYPASYEHVLSVSSTNLDDTKYSGSTFNYKVDITAPGANNFTTKNGGGFGGSGPGTSFASPLVAGAAALLRARFPDYTAQQVMEQLRVSADDNYQVGGNQSFFGQLGRGRLDIFDALTSTNSKSIRLVEFDYENAFGKFAFFADTIDISGVFTNFLAPTSNAMVSISTGSPYATILQDELSLGVMEELGTQDFSQAPLTLILSEDTPPDEQILIRLDYTDGIYEDWQFIQFNTTPDHIDLGTSSISLTVAGNGNLGYAQNGLEDGIGFQFDVDNLADHLGLIVYSDGKLIDNTVNNFNTLTRENDLVTAQNIRLFNNSTADRFALSLLDDSNAGAQEQGLFIEQKILSWDAAEDEQYLIMEYRISNSGSEDITDLKLGVFSDWEILDPLDNQIGWDAVNKLGYGFDEDDQSIFAGTALLTGHTPLFSAIDKGAENGNTPEMGIDFSKNDKADFITAGTSKTEAGLSGGNDVAQLIGAEIGALAVGESAKVAFMIGADHTLAALQQSVAQAQLRYSTFLANPPIVQTDTTCMNEVATISLEGTSYEFYSDPQGLPEDLLFTGNDLLTTPLSKDTLFYVQNIDQVYKSDMRTVRVRPLEIEPSVVGPENIVFLGDDPNNAVQFQDETFKAQSWLWDFDNGSGSTDDNPIVQFNETGDYNISLTVTNKFGCTAMYNDVLQVRERGSAPTFSTYSICPGESVSINSELSQTLRVYDSPSSETPLAEGMIFQSGTLLGDTVFYISNIDEEFESIKVEVPVNVDPLLADFTYALDTTDLENKHLIQFTDTSTGGETFQWTINGDVVEESNPLIDISDLEVIEVELMITNAENCSSVRTETITPAVSPAPTLSNATVCSGESFEIRPAGGTTFYFYGNRNLTQLLHKGSSYVTEELNNDVTYFVTGVDELLESEATEIAVTVIPPGASFKMDPKILILEDGNQVQFEDQTEGALSWQWSIDDELAETTQHPLLLFNEPGVYDISLTVSDEQGCTSSKTRTLEVLEVAGVQTFDLENLAVYPNPATNRVNIDFARPVTNVRIQLFDLAGRKHQEILTSKRFNSLNLAGLEPGLYNLTITNENGLRSLKLLIR